MKSLKTHMIVWNELDVRLTTMGDEDDRLYRRTHGNSAGCAYTAVREGNLKRRTKHLARIIKELNQLKMKPELISGRLGELEEYANLPLE